MEKPVVLITGASSGFGYEFAKLAADDGYNLVLVARSHDKLAQIAEELTAKHSVKVQIIAQDLTKPNAAETIVDELTTHKIEPDILINNAGYGTRGAFAEIPATSDLEMIQVNIAALTHLTKLILPGMINRGRGRILNVASTAAFQPGPFMAVYYASKAYVLSLSEALSEELRGTGVTVTALCPGPTNTSFQTRADMTGTRLFRTELSQPADVARIGYRAMLAGQRTVFGRWQEALSARLAGLAPRSLILRIVRSLQEGTK